MSALLGLLALVGASAACSSPPGEPQAVSLADLVAAQEDHDGSAVIVRGIVRTWEDPRHYWVEDDDVNRVELVPHEAVEDLVGHEIEVVGEFSFADDRGRVIDVDRIEVLREPTEG